MPSKLLFPFLIWESLLTGDYLINILCVGKMCLIYKLYSVYTQAEQYFVGTNLLLKILLLQPHNLIRALLELLI